MCAHDFKIFPYHSSLCLVRSSCIAIKPQVARNGTVKQCGVCNISRNLPILSSQKASLPFCPDYQRAMAASSSNPTGNTVNIMSTARAHIHVEPKCSKHSRHAFGVDKHHRLVDLYFPENVHLVKGQAH